MQFTHQPRFCCAIRANLPQSVAKLTLSSAAKPANHEDANSQAVA